MKQELSGIQVTTFFGINNFGNIEAMKVILFFKMLKILRRFQKLQKLFLILNIIALKLVAGISLNNDRNTCDRPSTF